MIGPPNDTRGFVLRTALLLAAASALLLPMLQSAPLERAEIYFLDVARGMVETGDYLVPRYRGEPSHLHWGVYVHGIAVDPRIFEKLTD